MILNTHITETSFAIFALLREPQNVLTNIAFKYIFESLQLLDVGYSLCCEEKVFTSWFSLIHLIAGMVVLEPVPGSSFITVLAMKLVLRTYFRVVMVHFSFYNNFLFTQVARSTLLLVFFYLSILQNFIATLWLILTIEVYC